MHTIAPKAAILAYVMTRRPSCPQSPRNKLTLSGGVARRREFSGEFSSTKKKSDTLSCLGLFVCRWIKPGDVFLHTNRVFIDRVNTERPSTNWIRWRYNRRRDRERIGKPRLPKGRRNRPLTKEVALERILSQRKIFLINESKIRKLVCCDFNHQITRPKVWPVVRRQLSHFLMRLVKNDN